MALTQSQQKKLQKFLIALGDSELKSLTRALEFGRTMDMDGLPLDEIMEMIRPALQELRPIHIPTLARTLCEPSEDFFVNAKPDVKRPAVIHRSFIQPFVAHSRALADGALDRLEAEMLTAFKDADWAALEAMKRETWAKAGALWRPALEEAERNDKKAVALRTALGGADRLEEVREAVRAIAAADGVLAVRALHPTKPIGKFKKPLADQAVDVLIRASNETPQAADMVLWTLFRRLRTPGEITVLFAAMDVQRTIWATCLATARSEIEATLLAENDAAASELVSAIKRGRLSADTLFDELERFLGEADAVQDACTKENKQIAKEKTTGHIRALSKVVERSVVTNADRNLNAALSDIVSVVKTGQETTAEIEHAIKKAEYIAAAFRRARGVVDRIGARSAYERERAAIETSMRTAEDVLKRWLDQNPGEDPDGRKREYVLYFCRIVEMISGPKAADSTRRRLFAGLKPKAA
ncbi:MAG: hypothetical protein RIB45_12600 [Marivibrio sp.]|uniref:hypothetical protein n=1 Tax=Marivibrio sp. TaxID=2039719 RepID=UPI0032EDD560